MAASTDWQAYVAIGISVASFLITYFGFIKSGQDRAVAQEKRMTSLETKVDLFWKVVETNVGQLLKSPTHTEKDMLLDKLAHQELNIEEAEKLRSILTDEMQIKGRDNGTIAYALIIGRLEGLLYEMRMEKNKKC
jgi:hypothetical protein